MSHWYDSAPKKSRRKRDSNPGSSALEADALPLGQRGGASRAPGLGSILVLAMDLFPGRVIPVTGKLVLQWLHCQAPGVRGPALGLVGPVSVDCD